MLKPLLALCTCALLGLLATLALSWPVRLCPTDPSVVGYRADMPHLECLAGRVVAETRPGLSAAQRRELWADWGLGVSFEWVDAESGFTYHELEVRPWSLYERAHAALTSEGLAPRSLPQLVARLNDDPRLSWACPDALLLEWCDALGGAGVPAGELLAGTEARPTSPAGCGVTLLDDKYYSFSGSLADWAQHSDWPEPLPDFEYYRLCAPDGSAVDWAPELAANETFSQRYPRAFGTNQALALAQYRAAGSPPLQPVTICVADTGVFMNHPDIVPRLHENAIDANYRNFVVSSAEGRTTADVSITDRDSAQAIGLPRLAIRGQPSWHGTAVAGLLARCTAGFDGGTGRDAVRLLPASVKSERSFAISGTRIKSPISAFIKLVACLSADFPTGGANAPASNATAGAEARPTEGIVNTGDVRVVSVSASVPKSYFSDAEWRVVANIAGKAAGAIAEDLRTNDRVYVFASGNDAQPEPNKPGEMDYVIAVAASMAFDGSQAWNFPPSGEGANMGQKCISAPGWGIITSITYPCPNLAYLPGDELPQPREVLAIPHRGGQWIAQTNRFSATSSATPQVSALAALLYAQNAGRSYHDVISTVEASCGTRTVSAPYGTARGLVDYSAALQW
jgi:hypothetical protein